MIRTLLIFVSFFVCGFNVSGQDTILINQTCNGLSFESTKTADVTSLNELPSNIQTIINKIFETSMTDFVSKIKFVYGQIIDLDKLAKTEPTFPAEYRWIVPKYELSFELCDTAINIKTYCFSLKLDQYGQIIDFDWARKGYNVEKDFKKGKIIINTAVRTAKKQNFKTDKFEYKFEYRPDYEKLCWEVSFLQKATGDKFNFSKEYYRVLIDATSLDVLDEFEEGEQGSSQY